MASWEDAYRESLRQRPQQGGEGHAWAGYEPTPVPDRSQPTPSGLQGGPQQGYVQMPQRTQPSQAPGTMVPNTLPQPAWAGINPPEVMNFPGAGAPPYTPRAASTSTAATTAETTGPKRDMPWGTFGTWDNWANAFAAQHEGRRPGVQDEADFWASQFFANQYGRGPSQGEWVNKWESGEWNQGMPWQLRTGSKYYGEPFQNMRGSAMPAQYRNAVASPGMLPPWLQQGFVPWYQQVYNGPWPTPGTPQQINPPQVMNFPGAGAPPYAPLPQPEWWKKGPGIIG